MARLKKSTDPVEIALRKERQLAGLKKGGRQNGFGRRKGVPDRASAEAKRQIMRFLTDPYYEENLMGRIMEGNSPIMEKYMWEFCVGKPTATLELLDKRKPTSLFSETLKALPPEKRKQMFDLLTEAMEVQAARADAVEVKALPEKTT